MPTAALSNKYDTPLTPEEEAEFRRQFPDYLKATHDYDLRGAFKAGVRPDPVTGHLPDTYKKPNHVTFSDESVYHGQDGNQGGHWTPRPDGSYTFSPGPTNLGNYGEDELSNYFQQYEKGNALILAPEEQ